jgi:hypothetical protein
VLSEVELDSGSPESVTWHYPASVSFVGLYFFRESFA